MHAVDFPVGEPFLDFAASEVQGIWRESTVRFPHAVRPMLAEAVVVSVHVCCADDADMIGMSKHAQVVRNNKHSLPVVASCVSCFRAAARCLGNGVLALILCQSVTLVEGDEYPALPRAANSVAVTAFHAVRDARLRDMSGAACKRPAVALSGKSMESSVDGLPPADNVIFHPGHVISRISLGFFTGSCA